MSEILLEPLARLHNRSSFDCGNDDLNAYLENLPSQQQKKGFAVTRVSDPAMSADRERGTSGFTLLELLVVITIIAVLAAILFPVAIHVKKRANQGVSLSNMRQCGVAMLIYAEDNHGPKQLPPYTVAKRLLDKMPTCDPNDHWDPGCREEHVPQVGSYGYAPAVLNDYLQNTMDDMQLWTAYVEGADNPVVLASPFGPWEPVCRGYAQLNDLGQWQRSCIASGWSVHVPPLVNRLRLDGSVKAEKCGGKNIGAMWYAFVFAGYRIQSE